MQAQWTNCAMCHQPTMFGYNCQRCGAPLQMGVSPMMGGPAMMAAPPKSGSNVGLIIGLAVGAVVLLCLGVGIVGFVMVKSSAEEARSSSSYSSSYSSGSGSGTTASSSSSSDTNQIGDRITMTSSTWTVIEVKDLGKKLESNNEYYGDTKRTTGRFVQVHYKVTNTGKAKEVLLDAPKLVDSKSHEYSAIEGEMDYVPSGKKTAILETLYPSIEQSFYTIIEVPADASDLKVQLTDLGFDGDTEEVDTDL